MSKSARQSLIRQLLDRGPIASQDELARALDHAGFAATQATISRDLRELGAIKTPEGYALSSLTMPGARRVAREPKLDHVMTIATSGSFVVLRTPPGMAQPTAIDVETSTLEGVVGTIAGDDTVFVAAPDAKGARALAKKLGTLRDKSGQHPARRKNA
ncbi:MAG: ArgR family transcriptional regulator [Planctomycetes bacterium]|nr:ArgR family transcriptional regulator [Planctomycetota bacterium]MCB9917091.1 ArgR family transcriptional regulator [Planctomycetota bacterium]